mmetsp:Transcript_31887/g.77447  ORF Transcript_31887/g.77447 Transcript_31887/m.77447 type:complete len:80 (-) Transcript_31887:46-285(-)
MSKITLSTAGYDNASTTVITIDATYNTHEIDSESYVTPDSATSSELHHRHQQQQQQQQQQQEQKHPKSYEQDHSKYCRL